MNVPTIYPLGMSWANCFRTHNELTMYPLGILPFAPSGDLSRQQARWQEFLAEYDFTIEYVKGEENTVADALSRMPEGEGEGSKVIATVLKISTDPKISDAIRVGYKSDAFCQRIVKNVGSFPTIRIDDGLIHIGSRLVIP